MIKNKLKIFLFLILVLVTIGNSNEAKAATINFNYDGGLCDNPSYSTYEYGDLQFTYHAGDKQENITSEYFTPYSDKECGLLFYTDNDQIYGVTIQTKSGKPFNFNSFFFYAPSFVLSMGNELTVVAYKGGVPSSKVVTWEKSKWNNYLNLNFTGVDKIVIQNTKDAYTGTIKSAPIGYLNFFSIDANYTLSFETNGGTEVKPYVGTFNQEYVNGIHTTTKAGHTFAGWYEDEALTIPGWDSFGESSISTKIINDKTYYAKWNINQYTVSFDVNGGSTVNPITTNYNTTITRPTDPTKPNYNFEGWFTDNSLTTPFDFATPITTNQTIYAKWIGEPKTIIFNTNGGSSIDPIIGNYGNTITSPTPPSKEGYTFEGWYKDDMTFANVWDFTADTVPENGATLYAQWTINTYTVTFKDHDGSELKVETVEHGSGAAAPAAPIREGHTFTGWDEAYTNVTSNITVTAQYSVNEYRIDFMSDGNTIESITADYGTTITAPSEPTKAGYTFGGWYKDEVTFANAWDFTSDTVPENGTTLYAQWNKVKEPNYTVVYDGNSHTGGTVPTDSNSYQEGANVGVQGNSGNLEKTGYTFVGWNTAADGSGIHYAPNSTFTLGSTNVTLYAQWQISSSGGGGGGLAPSVSESPKPEPNITPDGGLVSREGAKLIAPKGTVNENVVIMIQKHTEIHENWKPAEGLIISDIFEFTKDKSGNFKDSVTITLPFDLKKVEFKKHRIGIFWLNEETNEWVELDNVKVNLKDGTVSGEVDHFTKFAVLGIEFNVPSDISDHWAEENISELVGLGAITGYADGTFNPNNQITRAEFTAILVRALGLEVEKGKVFQDTEKHWAKDVIATAQAHGIIGGYDEYTFGANDPITREQMATMIVNAFKLKEAKGTTFKDNKHISLWAQNAVEIAASHGIITGLPDGSFNPKNNATRAEAATVIIRALNQ